MHRSEIRKLLGASSEEGYTIMPLQVYFKDGYAKIEIGLAKGKKLYDKRQDLRKKDMRREVEKDFKMSLRGWSFRKICRYKRQREIQYIDNLRVY